MKKRTLAIGVTAVIICLAFSLYLNLIQEYVAFAAWVMVIALFLPIFLITQYTDSLLLKSFVGIALFSQIISVPAFVLDRDTYTPSGWTAVKDFTFTFSEFIPIYSRVAFFLVAVTVFAILFLKIWRLPSLYLEPKEVSVFHAKSANTGLYLFILILITALMVPLNVWMFDHGIAMTGIEPPHLPYRLSGILSYLTSYVITLVLAIVYAKTTRSYLPTVILLLYATFIGVTHISKGVAFYAIFPIMYYTITDRRYALFSFTGAYALIVVQLVSLMRNVVYLVSGGKSGADTSEGLVAKLGALASSGSEFASINYIFVAMVNRIESAQDVILGYKFDVNAIGGIFPAFLGFNYGPWNKYYDMDNYHIEFKGIALPDGFGFGSGGMLAKSLMFTHSQPVYILIFALNVVIYLCLGEWLARRISMKYQNITYYRIVTAILAFFFYTNPGSVVFVCILASMLAVSLLPVYKRALVNHARN